MSDQVSGQMEFQATVTAVREVGRIDGRQVWQLALDRTPFMPGDTGELEARSRSGAVLVAPVTDVTVDALRETWHTTSKPLQQDTAVVARIFPLKEA